MADRPSERRCLGDPTPDLAGKEPGTPSTHARGQGGADVAKSFLRYPARHGGQAGQASGGRRRRPSRAFFAPRALRSEANGREPGRPAPPSIPSGGPAAAGLSALEVSDLWLWVRRRGSLLVGDIGLRRTTGVGATVKSQTSNFGIPPTPGPSPQGGGESARL